MEVKGWVPERYAERGGDLERQHQRLFKRLLSNRRMPEYGWSEFTVERFLADLAALDANNAPETAAIGDREGRVFSSLVRRRHFHLAHGIGRSGDLEATQPKATGSSVLHTIAKALVKDLFKRMGIKSIAEVIVLPVATGMAISLSLLAMRARKPIASKILWTRADQKTCLKALQSAAPDLEIIVADNVIRGDEVCTDLERIRALLEEAGSQILCVCSVTSCFAPRAPDDIVGIAKLCQKADVFHLVNNAFGLQSYEICSLIQRAVGNRGRIDCIVQSTDKNFMVPVGGSVVAGFEKEFIRSIAQTYPGRASSTPSLDVVITLLSMGWSTWSLLLEERQSLYQHFKDEMNRLSLKFGERLLETPSNPLSMAMSLTKVPQDKISVIGSRLYTQSCSGCRAVDLAKECVIGGIPFARYGSHHSDYTIPYLNFSATIGITRRDIELFMTRLDRILQGLALG
jgi:O-phospho-L-seryl-tRNASec:L-selenocysteinyl-tRNA synthase